MPCEQCNIQFTVFRRKRTCAECKRFYCSNCLSVSKRNSQHLLCERCAIFSKRPLLHSDLLQLKPKDLIFYLQSKHISTTGCVEKDELIRLVLNHVDQNDASRNNGHGGNHQTRNGPNDSFDSLKQTCQNFFFNITENISDTLAAFDSKSSAKTQSDNNNGNVNENCTTPQHVGGRERSSSSSNSSSTTTNTQHIFDQPRVSRREIPTYASSINVGTTSSPSSSSSPAIGQGTETGTGTQPGTGTSTTATSPTTQHAQRTTNPNPNLTHDSNHRPSSSRSTVSSDGHKSTSTSSSLASPLKSVSSIASQGQAPEPEIAQQERNQDDAEDDEEVDERPQLNLNVPKLSDCECSDDEIFVTYTARNSLTVKNDIDAIAIVPRRRTRGGDQENATTTANDTQASSSSTASSLSQRPIKQLDVQDIDETSHSSFEELGGAGAGCMNGAVSEDSGGSSNTEPWQILDSNSISNVENSVGAIDDTSQDVVCPQSSKSSVAQRIDEAIVSPSPQPPRRKLLRRRSDRQQRSTASDEDNSPTTTATATATATTNAHATDRLEGTEDDEAADLPRRRSGTCKRCGKSNLRRYVEKMRRHLESSQMSEADMKREMHHFLAYLEDQTKSVDYSETETTASPLPSEAHQNAVSSQVALSPNGNFRNAAAFYQDLFDENDGIHVYGAEAPTTSMADHNARFINLDDYDDIDDLETLSVKQLKEILMLHRVDYKGCCEKQELLDRVQRLWKNLKTAPAVDKLATDELCKICMDAPIECVILECGHMATCVTCGKVLSECPICRQYIVRVVRFFRA